MNFFIVVLASGQFIYAYGPAPQVAWSFTSLARCEQVMKEAVIKSTELPDGITVKCVTEPVYDAILAAGREQAI